MHIETGVNYYTAVVCNIIGIGSVTTSVNFVPVYLEAQAVEARCEVCGQGKVGQCSGVAIASASANAILVLVV